MYLKFIKQKRSVMECQKHYKKNNFYIGYMIAKVHFHSDDCNSKIVDPYVYSLDEEKEINIGLNEKKNGVKNKILNTHQIGFYIFAKRSDAKRISDEDLHGDRYILPISFNIEDVVYEGLEKTENSYCIVPNKKWAKIDMPVLVVNKYSVTKKNYLRVISRAAKSYWRVWPLESNYYCQAVKKWIIK